MIYLISNRYRVLVICPISNGYTVLVFRLNSNGDRVLISFLPSFHPLLGTVAMDLPESSGSSPDSVESGGGAGSKLGTNTLVLPDKEAGERRQSIGPVLEVVDGVSSPTLDLLSDQSEDESGEGGEGEESKGGAEGHSWAGHCE